MDDSAGKGIDGKGLGESENAAPDHKLPVVWSPKLNAADDIEDDDFGFGATEIPQGEKTSETASASGASSSRSGRFALLAASVSIAAAVGSFAATLAITGFNHAAPGFGAGHGAEFRHAGDQVIERTRRTQRDQIGAR